MSGGLGSLSGAPFKAAGTGLNTAQSAMDEQHRSQVAQMASQRILLPPTDPAGKQMYNEAMALRMANPGIVGAQGGSSFLFAPPVQESRQQLERDVSKQQFGRTVSRMLEALGPGNRFGLSRGNASSVPMSYTIPGAPSAVRPQPTGPLDPNSVLASMWRDGMAGTRTPAQMRLAELLGK